MRYLRIVPALVILGMLMVANLPYAKADAMDWDTFMSFSAPVEIPGMVLAPGKYEFRLLDNTGSGYLVAVLDAQGHYLEAIQAEATYRERATDKPVVKLETRNPKWPEAIRSWYYPDEYYGVKFVYPNSRPVSSDRPNR